MWLHAYTVAFLGSFFPLLFPLPSKLLYSCPIPQGVIGALQRGAGRKRWMWSLAEHIIINQVFQIHYRKPCHALILWCRPICLSTEFVGGVKYWTENDAVFDYLWAVCHEVQGSRSQQSWNNFWREIFWWVWVTPQRVSIKSFASASLWNDEVAIVFIICCFTMVLFDQDSRF